MGLAKRVSVNDRTGISQGHPVELPIPDTRFHFADHFARRHGGAGGNSARLFLPGSQQLDVRAADVDDENFGLLRRMRTRHSRCSHGPRGYGFFSSIGKEILELAFKTI